MTSCRISGALLTAVVLLTLAVWPALAGSGEAPIGMASIAAPADEGDMPSAGPLDLGRSTVVKIDELKPIDPGSTGVLEPGHGGLGVDMWNGTRLGAVERLLPALPAATASYAMRALARRLLLSAATVPEGTTGGAPLIELRAERLMALGETADLLRLLRALPRPAITARLRRLTIDALLLENQPADACAELDQLQRDNDAYAVRLAVLCRLLAGKNAEAALSLDLLRDTGVDDKPFFFAAESMLGMPAKAPTSLADPSPLQVALYRAAGKPLPADAATSPRPGLLRAVAASPATPIEVRLTAGERAEAMGALAADGLRALYDVTTFTPEQLAAPLGQGDADKGARGRALLFRAAQLQAANSPQAVAEIAARALALAKGGGQYFTAARLYAPLIQAIRPAPELAWFGGPAVRALYASGLAPAAQPWLALLRSPAGGTDGQATATALWPLARLAQAIEDKPLTDAAMAAWRKARAAGDGGVDIQAVRNRTVLLYSLLAAFGEQRPSEDWAQLVEGPTHVAATLPRPALWQMLRIAADDLRLGETVLLALVSLGEPGPARSEPTTLYRVLSSLRLVGLDEDARALAIEAAIAGDL